MKKLPQSDYSSLRIDTSDAEREYILINLLTNDVGNDLRATPEYVERDNRRRDEAGNPWRWVEYGAAA